MGILKCSSPSFTHSTNKKGVMHSNMPNESFIARGELNGNATKLTTEDVIRIRTLYARRGEKGCRVKMRQLAKQFNISLIHLRRVLHHERWAHVA